MSWYVTTSSAAVRVCGEASASRTRNVIQEAETMAAIPIQNRGV